MKLIGAIDGITPTRVMGWIYSDAVAIKGSKILAFLDDECVGVGRVTVFRQDLADAGLGDGHCGFDIKIVPPLLGEEDRVVVKLDGSDWVLLPPSSQIQDANSPTGIASLSPDTLEWARARGWFGQTEFDVVKALQRLGVYDRSLRVTKTSRSLGGPPVLDPKKEAHDLFVTLRMQGVELREHRPASVNALTGQRRKLFQTSAETVVALWCEVRSELAVVHGSHQDRTTLDRDLTGATSYWLAPDRLLLLDLRCHFGATAESPPPGLRVFSVAVSALE